MSKLLSPLGAIAAHGGKSIVSKSSQHAFMSSLTKHSSVNKTICENKLQWQVSRHYSPLPRYDPSSATRRTVKRRRLQSELNNDTKNRMDDIYDNSGYNARNYENHNQINHNSAETYSSNDSLFRPSHQTGVLSDAAISILSEPTLVVERKIEYMNLFLGFEQANNYDIMNAQGQVIGYLRERDLGIMKVIMRQVYKLHRPFDVDVLDLNGNVIMNIKRPFSFINSHIKISAPSSGVPLQLPDGTAQGGSSSGVGSEVPETILGETIQQWHLWRRKYNLFKCSNSEAEEYEQFGYVDTQFLGFDFKIRDSDGKIVALIDRTWGGFGREFLTDVATYIVRMDKRLSFNDGVLAEGEQLSEYEMSLAERAVLLANAVSIDFDYFSRHSRNGGGGLLSFGDYE